ncbi:MAG: Kazal-type serine protease inhibitor family protein [Candidatus Nealsonbacteria bacterium]|nr:Kazal-type serine protease inhibitor family protein [Candidatus Nealsonbacteria bacterium]
MSPENQEKFQEYVGKISGQKEKHLEIMGNLRAEIRTRKLREVDNEKVEMIRDLEEKIGKGKTKIIERVSEIVGGKIDCPFWAPPIPGFCKEGRMIIEKDPETGCPLPPRCIIPGEIEIPKPPIQPVPPERPEPGFCITIWDPVCGKDGKTYSNECFARLAGVEVDYKGVCRPIEKPIPEPPIRIPEPPIRIPGPPIERPIIGPLIPLIERPTEMPEIMPPPPIR